MIDIENQVFTEIYNVVTASYPNAKIESTLNLTPSEFPCVCVEEISNTTLESTIDSTSNENHATVTYEVNIFTNKTVGKKSDEKDILNLIDTLMIGFGFVRISKEPVALSEGTKYRIVIRYRAVVSKNQTLYRR